MIKSFFENQFSGFVDRRKSARLLRKLQTRLPEPQSVEAMLVGPASRSSQEMQLAHQEVIKLRVAR
jgi:hypothetical protein